MGGDRGAGAGIADHHTAKTRFQISQAVGQTEHRHDFRGHSNVKAVLPGHAVGLAAQAADDAAQLTVVHVYAAFPGDAPHVDSKLIALLDMVVQHGGQQVVGRADGVKVSCKMEVDILHGDHLGISAPGRAAFDAENRAQTGLPQSDHGVLSQAAHAVGQSHGGGGLALTCGRRVDGGDQYQLAVGRSGTVGKQLQVDFGFVFAVILQIILVHARQFRDVPDVLHPAGLCDFDVGLHSIPSFPCAQNTKKGTLNHQCAQTVGKRTRSTSGHTPCGCSTSVSRMVVCSVSRPARPRQEDERTAW